MQVSSFLWLDTPSIPAFFPSFVPFMLMLTSIGVSCQRADWPFHKASCNAKSESKWYDVHRKCGDGSVHFGELELITWEGIAPYTGEQFGWGAVLVEEVPELKRTFEAFGRDDLKMFEVWPQGYRYVKSPREATPQTVI